MLETVEKIILFSSSYKTAEEFYDNVRDFDAAAVYPKKP